MKNKFLLVCMILGSFAAVNKSYALDGGIAPSYKDVINNYIDGYMTGNYKKLDKVLSDDANVKIPRADVVLTHSKNSLMEQLKKDGAVKQNCESKYEVLDKSDAMIVAKVDFKYGDFTQHNYLVLEKDENKEWKITQVCKFFQDNVKPKVTDDAPNVTASMK
ncbi:MAG: nuclear transport factor 2 family protein [Bacteroidota bacterium]